MCENAEDLESKVRQLLCMGFGDKKEVIAALDSTNNDIDSAISVLVNVSIHLF